MSSDGGRLMYSGRSFHSIGVAAAKDLLPKFSKRHRRDVSSWFSLDRRVRVGECGMSCLKVWYEGVSWVMSSLGMPNNKLLQ